MNLRSKQKTGETAAATAQSSPLLAVPLSVKIVFEQLDWVQNERGLQHDDIRACVVYDDVRVSLLYT